MEPTFNSLISTPPSIALRASWRCFKRIKACVFAESRVFWNLNQFADWDNVRLTFPGAACLINCLRRSSWATASEATMMRSAFEAGVQTVATWPCKEAGVDTSQVDFQLAITDDSSRRMASLWSCRCSVVTGAASAGCSSSGRILTPSLASLDDVGRHFSSTCIGVHETLCMAWISIGRLRPVMMADVRSVRSPATRLAWLKGEPLQGQPIPRLRHQHQRVNGSILKVSSSLTPKLEIRLRQKNKVELTMGQVGNW